MVKLRDGTRVEKILGQSALLPLRGYGIRERAGNSGQSPPHFVPCHGIRIRFQPLFGSKVSREIFINRRSVGDCQSDLLHVLQLQSSSGYSAPCLGGLRTGKRRAPINKSAIAKVFEKVAVSMILVTHLSLRPPR